MNTILLAFVATLAGMLVGVTLGTLMAKGIESLVDHILK